MIAALLPLPPADDDPTSRGLAALPEPDPPHACDGGWTGPEDRPRPCPTCRPHLARRTTRDGITRWTTTERTTR